MATKKQIINDWQKIFPELKKQGSISLDNRLGPLITGIYIKVVRNTYYTPIFYVHNLCREYSSIRVPYTYLQSVLGETSVGEWLSFIPGCLIFTGISMVYYFWWVNHWEGNRISE